MSAKPRDLGMTPLDDLFSTDESRAEAQLEKVVTLNPADISDFPNHPFKVKQDEAMAEMVDSVKQYGVLVPALVRPKADGGYEMVAGHRRKCAATLAGIAEMPCIVRNLTDDEATIIMVDSNLQRETILPSEKAFAYKMKLEAMKRQAGRPSKENSVPLGQNFEGKTSRELLADKSPDSNTQIQRYIRLTELIPPVLDMVDSGKIAFRPAVELSYLSKEQQQSLCDTMECEDCTPSLAQAIKMKEFSRDGKLSAEVILSIMQEEKPNQREQFKMPKERISKYILPGKTVAFIGSSGVGKSTLINKLTGTDSIATREIGNDDKGRHTTTHRELITLQNGAFVIDTPGMRELGMWDSGDGIETAFADIEELSRACKYADCTHTSEPGCAVLRALSDGTLDAARLASYRKLKTENDYAADNSRYLEAKRAKFKEIAKINKSGRKNRY